MDGHLPPELASLLETEDARAREKAWRDFLERYSGLLLDAAERFGWGYDARMDRYRYILEALRKDDFGRLRSYRVQGQSTFRGWLAVVARRLCLDFERARYGRGGRATDAEESERERAMRRRLVDLAGVAVDPDDFVRSATPGPERRLRRVELRDALDAALQALEPRDRLLLKLRFEDDLSVRQIADVMRFPSVFHVYRRLKRVLEEVREGLVESGIEDAAP